MNIKTKVLEDGRYKVTSEQNGVFCTVTLPRKREALSAAIRSCYEIVNILEQVSLYNGCEESDYHGTLHTQIVHRRPHGYQEK